MHEMERWIRPLSRTGPGDGPFTTYRSLLYRSLTPIVAFHTVRVSLPKLYCRKLDFANTRLRLDLSPLDILMGRVTGNTVSFMNASIDISAVAFSLSFFLFVEHSLFHFSRTLPSATRPRQHYEALLFTPLAINRQS